MKVTDTFAYYKSNKDGTIVVGDYVDEILAAVTKDSLLDHFKEDMKSLELKDLGHVEYFLGMRISYDDATGYMLDQEQTIGELLKQNRLENAVQSLIADESSLDSESKEAESLPSKGAGTLEKLTVKSFQSLVGSLL